MPGHCSNSTKANTGAPSLTQANEQEESLFLSDEPEAESDVCKPKRPLSAYNIFFKTEREKILAEAPTRPEGKPRRSHGKIGFADLARSIALRWKTIDKDLLEHYSKMAVEDKQRYQKELAVWKKYQSEQKTPVVIRNKETAFKLSDSLSHHKATYQDDLFGSHSSNLQPTLASKRYYDRFKSKRHEIEEQRHNSSQYDSLMSASMYDVMSEDNHQQQYHHHQHQKRQQKQAYLEQKYARLGLSKVDLETMSTVPMVDGTTEFLYNEAIADLAKKIDDECVDFLISAFVDGSYEAVDECSHDEHGLSPIFQL
jgi:HMG-box domain